MISRSVIGPPDDADVARVGAAVVPLPSFLQAGSGGGGGGRPVTLTRCAYCGGGLAGHSGHAASCRQCWWRGGVVQPADLTGDPTVAHVLIDDRRDLAYIDLLAAMAVESRDVATTRRTAADLRTERALADLAARQARWSSAWGWWAALVGAFGTLGGVLLQSTTTDVQIGGGTLWCVAAVVFASGGWGTPWWVLRAGVAVGRAP